MLENSKAIVNNHTMRAIYIRWQSPTLGAHAHAHPCPWVLGGHGCDIIGNVTIFEYMGAI